MSLCNYALSYTFLCSRIHKTDKNKGETGQVLKVPATNEIKSAMTILKHNDNSWSVLVDWKARKQLRYEFQQQALTKFKMQKVY